MKLKTSLLLSIMALVPVLDSIAAPRQRSSGAQAGYGSSRPQSGSGSTGAMRQKQGMSSGYSSGFSSKGSSSSGYSSAGGSSSSFSSKGSTSGYSGSTSGSAGGAYGSGAYASKGGTTGYSSGSTAGKTGGTTGYSSGSTAGSAGGTYGSSTYSSKGGTAGYSSGSTAGKTGGTTGYSSQGTTQQAAQGGQQQATQHQYATLAPAVTTKDAHSYTASQQGASQKVTAGGYQQQGATQQVATGGYQHAATQQTQQVATTGGYQQQGATQQVATGGYQQQGGGYQQQAVQKGGEVRTVEVRQGFRGRDYGYGRGGHEVVGGYQSVGGGYVGGGYVGGQVAATQVEAVPVVYGATETYAPVVEKTTVQTYAPVVKAIETTGVAETYAPLVTGIKTVIAKNILIRGKAERGFNPFHLCALQQSFFEGNFLGHAWGWWFDNYFPFFIGVFPFLFYAEYKVYPPLYYGYASVFGEFPKPIENFEQFVRGILPWPTIEEVPVQQVAQQVQVAATPYVKESYAQTTTVPGGYSGGFFGR